MQQVVYKCDDCKVEIGPKKHISLRFGNNSGIATPPGGKHSYWHTEPTLNGKFLHFCSPKCLAHYFLVLINPPKK